MRTAPTSAWVWAFTAYSWLMTTVSAAWFARRFATQRGIVLDVPTSLLWQGAIYAAWLPAAGLVWWVLRWFGAGARGLAASLVAGLMAVPLEALASSLIDQAFIGGTDLAGRVLGRVPVCILLYTAIVAVGLAAAHHRKAAEARARNALLEAALAQARAVAAPSEPERLMVMTGARRVPVETSAVEWFGAADNYVVVHWGDSREGLLRATLQSLEARLDPRLFARAHRSALINLAHVREAQPLSDGSWRLTLASGAEVVTSRTYREEVLKRLGR
ncbi:LytTR family DNA-binding domain-containing protein [Caulobacter segnis]|uniref:LytTR family DNA-binding domain-containing protein n=1 Tax=Caulobacter segnis TaxID=88688 RepID=UPI001CC13F1D|nr:LytTR family DNA-binding domain-containing protein [Caulobacter segnis]UAL12930.1 LytTR family DNA-binding domain-containing protein [Caulobacter segnis]